MKIVWELNIGTMIHLVVLVAGIIGFWLKLRIRMAVQEERFESLSRAFIEIKSDLTEVKECMVEMRVREAEVVTGLKELSSRLGRIQT